MECRTNQARRTVSAAITALVLAGCADSPAIQPANSSKSKFESSACHGETVTVRPTSPGVEEYRVFQERGSGFVSIQSVRESAEQRATAFCEATGKAMLSLRETTATPPYILGNFPRVEIIFGCVDKDSVAGKAAGDDPQYAKLVNLKKLLDAKVITQQEFEAEKAKILSAP
jgi:hypothetical protein